MCCLILYLDEVNCCIAPLGHFYNLVSQFMKQALKKTVLNCLDFLLLFII